MNKATVITTFVALTAALSAAELLLPGCAPHLRPHPAPARVPSTEVAEGGLPGPNSATRWQEGSLAESSEPGVLIESIAACADSELALEIRCDAYGHDLTEVRRATLGRSAMCRWQTGPNNSTTQRARALVLCVDAPR